MGTLFNRSKEKSRRKELRRQMTWAEQKVWWKVRNNQLGVRFRRQYSVGPFILDFYCPKQKLAVEIDGDFHFTRNAQCYDRERTEYLRTCGIRVIRFTNIDVCQNIEGAIQEIQRLLG